MRDLVIFGAGGLGREVLMLVRQINQQQPQWNPIGFYDDQDLTGQTIAGLPYLGNSVTLNAATEIIAVAIAIGSAQAKKAVVSRLTNPLLHYPVLCHPDSEPEPYQEIEIGEGCIICKGVILTCNIRLGKQVLLNLACTVGHDAELGDFCSLMPGVHISGENKINEAVYFGTNSSTVQQIQIGSNSVIGAGAVVTNSLPDGVTAVGVPARIVKENNHA